MLTLLQIYCWTILAGTIAAAALSLLGAHLAARDKAMQTLCVGQGASLGVLVGLGIVQSFEVGHTIGHESYVHLGPFASAALFSLGTFQLSEVMVRNKDASKSTIFLALFSCLLAMGYLTTALFPALESHMTQIFFGDVATLSNTDSVLTSILSLIVFGTLVVRWRPLSNESFEAATFGTLRSPNSTAHPLLFHVIALVTLCFSVQFLGFLFTIACLFLPTALLRFRFEKRLRKHFLFAIGVSASSTFLGFLMSLSASRLPTVPTIVAFMMGELLVLIGWDRFERARA